MKTRFDGATPGPWQEDDGNIFGPGKRQVFICTTEQDAKNFDKNAELIAAAPDLLRVACELAEALREEINCCGPTCEKCQRVARNHPVLAAFHALVDPKP